MVTVLLLLVVERGAVSSLPWLLVIGASAVRSTGVASTWVPLPSSCSRQGADGGGDVGEHGDPSAFMSKIPISIPLMAASAVLSGRAVASRYWGLACSAKPMAAHGVGIAHVKGALAGVGTGLMVNAPTPLTTCVSVKPTSSRR